MLASGAGENTLGARARAGSKATLQWSPDVCLLFHMCRCDGLAVLVTALSR